MTVTEPDADPLAELSSQAQRATDERRWADAWPLWMSLSDAAAAAQNWELAARAAGQAALHLTDVGDDAQAVLAYERSRDTFAGMRDPHGSAHASLALGPVYRRLGRFAESIAALDIAIDHFDDHSPRGLADARAALASTLHDVGDLPHSLELFEAALAFYEMNGTPEDVARCTMNLGGLLASLGRSAEGLLRVEEALRFRRGTGDAAEIARALSNYGTLLIATGRTDEGIAALIEARDTFAGLQRRRDVAFAEFSLGSAYLKLGYGNDVQPLYEAHARATSALEHFTSVGDHHEAARCVVLLGVILLEGGQFDQARKNFTDMQRLFAAAKVPLEVAKLDHDLAILDERVGLNTRDLNEGTRAYRASAQRAAASAVYLDSVRLGLGSGDQRRAWTEGEVAGTKRLALSSATRVDDAQLVVGLICRFRSSGYPRTNPGGQVVRDRSIVDGTLAAHISPPLVASAGAARLLGDARSVVPPPPLVRLPNGRIAADIALLTARLRYGRLPNDRPDAVAYLLA